MLKLLRITGNKQRHKTAADNSAEAATVLKLLRITSINTYWITWLGQRRHKLPWHERFLSIHPRKSQPRLVRILDPPPFRILWGLAALGGLTALPNPPGIDRLRGIGRGICQLLPARPVNQSCRVSKWPKYFMKSGKVLVRCITMVEKHSNDASVISRQMQQ